MKRTCKDCHYYYDNEACRRYPATEYCKEPTDWCGEFKPNTKLLLESMKLYENTMNMLNLTAENTNETNS